MLNLSKIANAIAEFYEYVCIGIISVCITLSVLLFDGLGAVSGVAVLSSIISIVVVSVFVDFIRVRDIKRAEARYRHES